MSENQGGRRQPQLRPRLAIKDWFTPLFAGWTLFVWGGRLRNLWQEPGPLADVSRWSLAGSIIFSVLGLVVLGLWLAGGRGPLRAVVAVLAAFTTVIWLIRAVDIAIGDHSVPFIVVHVVLAVVSIALAVLAMRSVSSAAPVIASSGADEPGRSPVG